MDSKMLNNAEKQVSQLNERLNEGLSKIKHKIKVGKSLEVITALEKITAKYPDIAKAWYYLSVCYAQNGQEKDAYTCAEKAVALGNESANKVLRRLSSKIKQSSITKTLKSGFAYSTRTFNNAIPFAEMYAKAGFAIWVLLGLMMMIIHDIRLQMGLLNALVVFAVIIAVYVGYILKFLYSPQNWISDDTADPKEQLVLKAVKIAAERTSLPIPRIAIDKKYKDINAFTYGLGTKHANIVVTEAFLDKLQPTEDELVSVLVHELGHIKHNDYIVSTMLQFPIWVMQKIQMILGWARIFASFFLKGFLASGLCFGFVGLVLC